MGSETYHHLKKLIQAKYGLKAANVGDEGGFSPPLSTFEDALDLLVSAIKVSHPDSVIFAVWQMCQATCLMELKWLVQSAIVARQGT